MLTTVKLTQKHKNKVQHTTLDTKNAKLEFKTLKQPKRLKTTQKHPNLPKNHFLGRFEHKHKIERK